MTVLLDEDGVDGAGGGGAQHVLTLRLVRGGIVPERFLPMQLEDAGGEKTTLGIGLAPVEINHHMDGTRRCRRWCQGWLCLCHLLFLFSCVPPLWDESTARLFRELRRCRYVS